MDRNMRQQQAEIGVVDAPALRHKVQRQYPGDIRHASEDVDRAKPGSGDRTTEARQHIAARHCDHEREHSRERRDQAAIDEGVHDALFAQHLRKIAESELEAAMNIVHTRYRS